MILVLQNSNNYYTIGIIIIRNYFVRLRKSLIMDVIMDMILEKSITRITEITLNFYNHKSYVKKRLFYTTGKFYMFTEFL